MSTLLWTGCATPPPTTGSLPEAVSPAQPGTVPTPPVDPQTQEQAYEHNRSGMMKMAMARFDEAIVDFQMAAEMMEDYTILDRPLVYTPVFMIAWAYEKLGDGVNACKTYQRFLDLAPGALAEPSKVSHARDYLDRCRG